ncbi:Nucleolar complex protein [Ananas comosus]|uniref:Nucleolar complex protein n=1 Tax=Ananas comosus TaxID=4615 RepID=A0A199UFC0_ANACO|nr:Nucleolar complex protein [Ananas comosus]
MAKKLGKKARKFAKKNLQSVLKRRRKLKSTFKRRAPPRRVGKGDGSQEDEKMKAEQNIEENAEAVSLGGSASVDYLENLFGGDDEDLDEDVSESDGYLSEDPDCPYISESERENDSSEESGQKDLTRKNKEIVLELVEQKKKLDSLIEKEPDFSSFLEKCRHDMEISRREELYSDEEDDTSFPDGVGDTDNKVLTSPTIDVWCWLVKEEPNGPALRNLLSGFQFACRYGIDSDEVMAGRIQSREVFSKMLMFLLCEADGIFRRMLGISDSLSKVNLLKVKNKPEWKTASPLIKSYLRSSLYLLNQVTDNQILNFVLSQLRASVVFFSAFPSLARRLIKISVHLWATGDQSLSSSSFLIIHDIASQSPSDYVDMCLTKTYKSFIASSKFVDDTNLKHIEFLVNSLVELYSLEIEKSYERALTSLQQLASILRQAYKTKKKEELRKIHNWQYINCLKLWVKFVTCNFRDNDFQQLIVSLIQVITGVAHLFHGPRYLPLRLKCVQMLNELSLSCGVFIPIASLLFDSLDYRELSSMNEASGIRMNFPSLLKVPKQLLKSQEFQTECILSVVELLSAHFGQWSYHISFPELATIPLILLKRFYAKTSIEGLRRPVKRLIDQVEQNRDFIQRKRDEVSFSPNDQQSVESFLQFEKSGSNASFTQYYASILQSSRTRNTVGLK